MKTLLLFALLQSSTLHWDGPITDKRRGGGLCQRSTLIDDSLPQTQRRVMHVENCSADQVWRVEFIGDKYPAKDGFANMEVAKAAAEAAYAQKE